VIIEKSIVEQRIISVQNGNMEDFDLLYRYTREFLYMYALSVVKDYYMADDAVQEAFIRAYRYIHKYRPGTNPLAWLIEITKNAAINAKNNGSSVIIVDTNPRIKSNRINPESFAEDALYVDYILKKLPAGERQVVVMHLYGELTFKETANALKLPVTTVEWRYKSAIRKLKKALDKSQS
jgi:RNA polymerase sigma-70 factor (ECF subfamily)